MFSEKLYTLRKEKDLSQKELAALVGVTNKAISKWETGAAFPKTETIIKLAEIFNVSSDELLDTAVVSKKETLQTEEAGETKDEQQDKNEKAFSSKTAIFYLIFTVTILFGTFAIALLVLRDSWGKASEFTSASEILGISFAIAFIFSSIHTGIFLYVLYLKKLSSEFNTLSVLRTVIYFFAFLCGGVILIIPTVVKCIKELIEIETEKNIIISKDKNSRRKVKWIVVIASFLCLAIALTYLFSNLFMYDTAKDIMNKKDTIATFTLKGDLIVFHCSEDDGYAVSYFKGEDDGKYRSELTINKISREYVYEMGIPERSLNISFAVFEKTYEIPESRALITKEFYDRKDKNYFCILGVEKKNSLFKHTSKLLKDEYYSYYIVPEITEVTYESTS